MNEHIKDSTTELGATIRSAHESKAQTSWIPSTLVLEGTCIGQNGPTDHTHTHVPIVLFDTIFAIKHLQVAKSSTGICQRAMGAFSDLTI